jgi:hypothetical protein
MRRPRLVTGLAILAVSALLGAAAALKWLGPKVEPPAWADDYDVTAAEPESIAPGTVIERGPPAGWSHLVIKSEPRVKPSEAPRVPLPRLVNISREEYLQQVSWMFTAFTADVVGERQGAHVRHRLRAVGLGLGAKLDGRDTVLAPQDAARTVQGLGFPKREIQQRIRRETLEKGYGVQKQARIAVHSPLFGLVDTPVTFRCGQKNRMVRFRYALLVDGPTGRLDVLCWRLGGEGDQCSDPARAVLLPPNDIDPAELVPDPAEFNALNIPSELAFGVDDLPPHRLEVTIPAGLRALAGRTRFTAGEARALENGLRKLLPTGE